MRVTRRGARPDLPVRARTTGGRAERTPRPHRRRIACTVLAASVGFGLLEAGARRPAPQARIPTLPPVHQATSNAMMSHGEEDDQPAGACWLAHGGGASAACVCSVGSVEDLLTPDFMRVVLTNWRDAGRLTTGEWRGRMQDVEVACTQARVGL